MATAEPALRSGKAVASAVLHESFQGSTHHRGLAGPILDRQLGGDGTLPYPSTITVAP
jgi:hypothetical protein